MLCCAGSIIFQVRNLSIGNVLLPHLHNESIMKNDPLEATSGIEWNRIRKTAWRIHSSCPISAVDGRLLIGFWCLKLASMICIHIRRYSFCVIDVERNERLTARDFPAPYPILHPAWGQTQSAEKFIQKGQSVEGQEAKAKHCQAASWADSQLCYTWGLSHNSNSPVHPINIGYGIWSSAK